MVEQFSKLKVEFVNSNQVMVVTLNNPPANALDLDSYEDIIKVVSIAEENEEIRAIILRADGKIFCGGANFKTMGDSPELSAKRRATYRKASTKLYNCPVPVITVLQGGAAGAGAVLAASGDIIIASEEAFLSLPEVDISLVGGARGIWRILPQQKVRMMALTGMRVPATDVYRWGGIEKVVSKEKLMETAMNFAQIIAEKGSMAGRKWKEALTLTERLGPQEGLLIEMCLGHDLSVINQK